MSKKKFYFIVFEGIEGSGKSYQSKKLYKNIIKAGFNPILTREPGGTKTAEFIRALILKDYFKQIKNDNFDKYTDTLLYLAARNEHVKKKIEPAKLKKKILICDRFTDSTIAYQVYGKGVDKKLIEFIHKYILKNIKPDLTIVLKVKLSKALQRLSKRKIKNRYDKFSKNFYSRAQNGFLRIAKKNKSKYLVFDNSKDDKSLQKKIFSIVRNKLNL